MSGYTEQDMMAAAEAHYRHAASLLDGADARDSYEDERDGMRQNALAEAHAGMLAIELARYVGAGEVE